MNDETRQTTTLDERLAREAQFHDEKYGGADLYPKHYALAPTKFIFDQLKSKIAFNDRMHLLEYGCGEGWTTQELASSVGHLSAFDVSPQAIENTAAVLQRRQLQGKCELAVMPAEKLTYPAGSFDVAVGFAILHHLEMESAIAELHRVLKPGGVAFFAEPLATNPFIQLYRRLTPQFRTPDERPLVLRELPSLFSRFSRIEHSEYFLTAIAALSLAHIPMGIKAFPAVSRLLHGLDRRILSVCPSLGNWAWYSIIKVTK